MSSADAAGGPATPVPINAALFATFKTPVEDWRRRVWWHWMSPNVTKDGIIKDLDWFKRVGVGGYTQFTGDGRTAYVPDPVGYLTPLFNDCWKTAIQGAADRGLEAIVTSSAGWSITGAPFVAPADGMKKHVWTETWVDGGKPVTVTLPPPPTSTGTFLDKTISGRPTYYKDQQVFAFPVPDGARSQADLNPNIYVSNGDVSGVLLSASDASKLSNDSVIDPVSVSKDTTNSVWIRLEFLDAITVGGLTISVNGTDFAGWVHPTEDSRSGASATVEVFSSADGVTWGPGLTLKDSSGSNFYTGAQRSLAMEATTAKFFKVQFSTSSTVALTKLVLRTIPTVHKWEHKAGFGAVGNFYEIDTPVGGLAPVDSRSVVDLTGAMDENGVITWTPPKGRWVIARFGYSLTGHQNRPAAADATGLEVDKLDPVRVRTYMETYLDQFQSIVPPSLWGGNGLTGLTCDSIEAGFQTWTDGILDEFAARRGYSASRYLPALIGVVIDSAEATDKFLWDWRTTLGDMLVDHHYGTVADVAHERGLANFYAEAQEDARGFFGDDTAIRRKADIPMGASRSNTALLGGVLGEQFRLDMKGASSIAHVYGRPYAACETMTSTSIQYVPRDVKPFIDQCLIAGVTRIFVHSSDHQPLNAGPGTSLGPGWYFSRNQTWAELAGPFVTWMARTTGVLNQGLNVADVAMFYGQEGPLTVQWLVPGQPDIPDGCQYDFVDHEIIENELTLKSDGTLTTAAGVEYKLVHLTGQATRMTYASLVKISSLVNRGATISGSKPTMSPSLDDPEDRWQKAADALWGDGTPGVRKVGKGRVITGMSPDQALAAIEVAPDWTYTGTRGTITAVHRSLPGSEVYYIVNNNHASAVTTDLTFRAVGSSVEIWDPVTGDARLTSFNTDTHRTALTLTLGAGDAVFVVIARGKPGERTVPPISEQNSPVATGPWTVTFDPPRGTPDTLQLAALSSLSLSTDFNTKYYSGTVIYTGRLNSALDRASIPADARVLLDLGEVNEFAEVVLNGKELNATLWRAPYRVDVTDVLVPAITRSSYVSRMAGTTVYLGTCSLE